MVDQEVEDVKTFLRLQPLVTVPTLATAFYEQNIEIIDPELYGCYDSLEGFLSFNANISFHHSSSSASHLSVFLQLHS